MYFIALIKKGTVLSMSKWQKFLSCPITEEQNYQNEILPKNQFRKIILDQELIIRLNLERVKSLRFESYQFKIVFEKISSGTPMKTALE
jgi:hypothetical protein